MEVIAGFGQQFGHIYVLHFADGLVKVGRAGNVNARVKTHRSWGRCNGNPLTRQWVSVFIGNLQPAEAELTAWCRERGRRAWGAEWFYGIDHDAAVECAAGLVESRALSPVTGRRPRRVDSCGTLTVFPLPVVAEPESPSPRPLLDRSVPIGAYARAPREAPSPVESVPVVRWSSGLRVVRRHRR